MIPQLTEEQIAGSREAVLDGDDLLDVTGYLDGVVILTGLTARYLSGRISSDLHGRYPDNYPIHTSYILRELEPGVFLTRSRNVYRVRSWHPEALEA